MTEASDEEAMTGLTGLLVPAGRGAGPAAVVEIGPDDENVPARKNGYDRIDLRTVWILIDLKIVAPGFWNARHDAYLQNDVSLMRSMRTTGLFECLALPSRRQKMLNAENARTRHGYSRRALLPMDTEPPPALTNASLFRATGLNRSRRTMAPCSQNGTRPRGQRVAKA